MTKHSLLSASASSRWLNCPGSVYANLNRKSKGSKYALLGSSAHSLLEVALRLGVRPLNFNGVTLEKGHVEVSTEMSDAVEYAIEYVNSYLANAKNATLYVEQRLEYGDTFGCSNSVAFGTGDIVILNKGKEAVIADYKHGEGITVGTSGNPQLLTYVAGVRQKWGSYPRYRMTIIQPRARGIKPIRETVITNADLDKWLTTEVRPIVPIALDKHAPRVAGKHCRFCAASGTCPAQYVLIQQAAKKDFMVCNKKK